MSEVGFLFILIGMVLLFVSVILNNLVLAISGMAWIVIGFLILFEKKRELKKT